MQTLARNLTFASQNLLVQTPMALTLFLHHSVASDGVPPHSTQDREGPRARERTRVLSATQSPGTQHPTLSPWGNSPPSTFMEHVWTRGQRPKGTTASVLPVDFLLGHRMNPPSPRGRENIPEAAQKTAFWSCGSGAQSRVWVCPLKERAEDWGSRLVLCTELPVFVGGT